MNTKALFIGPYGENRETFEKWVSLLLQDVIQWRRNFHPNDPNLVSLSEKTDESFVNTFSNIEETLDAILAELKQSLPYHSPRYLGHMLSVLSMPALLGYFAGLLYNQNNVVGEVSPVTTRLELEFMAKLCEMIGYAPLALKYEGKPASYGHLTSGGSTAILEGLWVARNIKYYPLSLKLFLKSDNEQILDFQTIIKNIDVRLTNGEKKSLKDASVFELFNISPDEVLDIIERINHALGNQEKQNKFQEIIEDYLVQSKGVAEIHSELGGKLSIPKLYVSQTSHYAWKKNMDILGFGKNSVVHVKSDKDFKMDVEDLEERIRKNSEDAVLMVVAIAGTTEEGAVDPIADIFALREKLDKSFYFKVDAAWGGYYASIYKNRNSTDSLPGYLKSLEDDIQKIKQADSVVIDPHKQGYIPYAVGAVAYKDTRYKNFIYKGAPYLATSKIGIDPIENTYLGGWTLEGSRSGAAAIACAMSTRTVPLDATGYGKIIAQGIKMCMEFYQELEDFNKTTADFKIVPVFKPQTNVACYMLTSEYIKDVKYLNKLNGAVKNAMSFHPGEAIQNYEYFLSGTDLNYGKYAHVLTPLISGIKIKDKDNTDITLLRSVFMNPNLQGYQVNQWIDNKNVKVPILGDFLNKIVSVGKAALPSILLEILKEKNEGKRLKVLWVENKDSFETIKNRIELNEIQGVPAIGQFLDIDFDNYQSRNAREKTIEQIKREKYDFILFDLNLADNHHIEWQSGLDLIQDVYRNGGVNAKGIIYSQFLVDKNNSNTIKRMLTTRLPNHFTIDCQFIGKFETEDKVGSGSLAKIIKSIFQLSQ